MSPLTSLGLLTVTHLGMGQRNPGALEEAKQAKDNKQVGPPLLAGYRARARLRHRPVLASYDALLSYATQPSLSLRCSLTFMKWGTKWSVGFRK